MANPFPVLLGNLNQMGVFQFLFPFLLILAVAYGTLNFGLGEKKILPKSANALISLIIAFFVMNYSGGVGSTISVFFSQLFGQGLIIAVGILLLMILVALFGIKPDDLTSKDKYTHPFTIVVGLLALFIFLIFAGAGNLIGLGSLNLDNNFWTAIVFVIILAAVIWALSREPKAAGKDK